MDKNNVINAYFQDNQPDLRDRIVTLLMPLMSVESFPKKHFLLKENQYCNKIYLMVKGASRSFYLHNGFEINLWFAFEDEVVGSLRNFNNLPAKENIELLEDSTLISFDIQKIKNLMTTEIEVSHFVNNTLLEYALFIEDKFFELHMKPAQEKFNTLLQQQPEIFQRVPLTYIASYLGISRETLSRIRAK